MLDAVFVRAGQLIDEAPTARAAGCWLPVSGFPVRDGPADNLLDAMVARGGRVLAARPSGSRSWSWRWSSRSRSR
jgi:hypothetical protein